MSDDSSKRIDEALRRVAILEALLADDDEGLAALEATEDELCVLAAYVVPAVAAGHRRDWQAVLRRALGRYRDQLLAGLREP